MPLGDKDQDPGVAAEAANEEEQKPKKKGLPGFAIYIAIALVMIVAGYFVGTKFIIGSSGQKGTSEAVEEHDRHAGENKDIDLAKTQTVTIDDIVVNPSGTGGTRFLAASIGFEIATPETAEVFEKRMPMIRDALITILGSKTIEQLSDPKEKEIIRYQIKKRVEQLLSTDDLLAVYYTDFILQ